MTESPLTRLVRALLLAAAAIVLLGLVVVAAGGHRFAGTGSSKPTPYAVDTILTIVLALSVVGAVTLLAGTVWAGFELRRNPLPARRQRRTTSGIFLALGLLALLLVASDRFHWHLRFNRIHAPPAAKTATTGTTAGSGAQSKARKEPAHEPHFRLVPFLVVLGGAGAAAGALYVAERRRKRRLPLEDGVAEDLVTVLDDTLLDLREERDPRRAVIAAYARMERVLAAHGVPRRRFEAPHEYLARVLAELTGGGTAVQHLTALFERARFSAHAVDAAMKEEAIGAVRDLQSELAAAEAAEAA